MNTYLPSKVANSFGFVNRCKIVYAPFRGTDQFLSGAATQYEHALLEAVSKGTKSKPLIICNPHNPFGDQKPFSVFDTRFRILTISRFLLYYRLPERALALL